MLAPDRDVAQEPALWITDDVASVRFPIYTRGNMGEVYPNVVTPLSGSVIKEPFAEGQAQAFMELGTVVPADLAETERAVLSGCFGGYLYANLSLGRLMGARTPGMSPEDVDTQLFGASDAPPYRRQKGDRSLSATLRLTRMMLRTLRGPDFAWLRRERDETTQWVRAQPVPASATEAELFATVDDGARRLPALMRSLLMASAHGGIAAVLVDRFTAKADPEVRARLGIGIGDVESAGPASALWRMGQLVSATPALAEAFDAGPGVASRLEGLGPAAEPFRAALDEFLATYGARGPDEWELASDTWGTCPDIALAAVERIRHARGPDPVTLHDELARQREAAIAQAAKSVPWLMRRRFVRATQTVAEGAAGREFAKGTIVQSAHAVRLALSELIRRAQARGGPADRRDGWLLTIDELPAFVASPGDFAGVIAERRARRDYLQARVPPFVFEGRMPDPETWPLRNSESAGVMRAEPGQRLEGIGVAPGSARGPVRIVRDPSDPAALEPGDVLVAPITDPAWTPLFLVASAVVVNVGAQMSHAAIVARELGIPAVVSVSGATDRLEDGVLVEVDGTHGSVLVLPLL